MVTPILVMPRSVRYHTSTFCIHVTRGIDQTFVSTLEKHPGMTKCGRSACRPDRYDYRETPITRGLGAWVGSGL